MGDHRQVGSQDMKSLIILHSTNRMTNLLLTEDPEHVAAAGAHGTSPGIKFLSFSKLIFSYIKSKNLFGTLLYILRIK